MLVDKIKLEANEEVLSQTRRHWFVLVAQLSFFVVAAIFPALILWLLPTLASEQIKVDLATYTSQISYLYSVWLLFLWFGMFSVWTNYYLDILIITDRRLILINQKGFFRRNVGSFRLERMQDINVEVNGIIATLLDYGTIHVETAGHGDEEFRATDLPKPREIKAEILRAGDSRIPKTPKEMDTDSL